MSKYRVSLGWICFDDYIIEAEDKDSALLKAREMCKQGHGAQGEGEPFRAEHFDEVNWEA